MRNFHKCFRVRVLSIVIPYAAMLTLLLTMAISLIIIKVTGSFDLETAYVLWLCECVRSDEFFWSMIDNTSWLKTDISRRNKGVVMECYSSINIKSALKCILCHICNLNINLIILELLTHYWLNINHCLQWRIDVTKIA